MRYCDSCGTKLPTSRGHGFVKGRKLVCGRTEILKVRSNQHGQLFLREVDAPRECRF